MTAKTVPLAFLAAKAKAIRRYIITMVGPRNRGHIGGSCSIADIVAVLYFHTMHHDPKNPSLPGRDRFLLSKGHAALAQYAALAECGYFPAEELPRLKHLGGMLQGHPDMKRTPGVEANTGSLGQGLSIACGMALGLRLDGIASRVFCIVGDGEMDEGQIWEAAMAASYYRLDRLVAILDRNRLQATGAIAELMDNRPTEEKWRAFGWHVMQVDGHDIGAVAEALDRAGQASGKPTVIIADTVKGKGVSFAENNPAFHNGEMTDEEYQRALGELA